jgi:hypothetical protein
MRLPVDKNIFPFMSDFVGTRFLKDAAFSSNIYNSFHTE